MPMIRIGANSFVWIDEDARLERVETELAEAEALLQRLERSPGASTRDAARAEITLGEAERLHRGLRGHTERQ